MKKSVAFTQVNSLLSYCQVIGALFLLLLILFVMKQAGLPYLILGLPLLALIFVRIFVLEHDCGHQSLFKTNRENVFWGRLLGCITGVAYDGWKHEHNWHHSAIGIMEKRGIDRTNSPLTVEEAYRSPEKALQFFKKVSPLGIALYGFYSLLIERKRSKAFFMFRSSYRWANPFRDAIVKNLILTNIGHGFLHILTFYFLGAPLYFLLVLPAMLLGAMIGASLFWIQHNFEDSYLASQAEWSYVTAALKGSSYVRLPKILAWFTADIGLHHVHHLNPRIPNYRLEEARRGLEELKGIAPLNLQQIKACYTKLFWDPKLGKKVDLPDLRKQLLNAK